MADVTELYEFFVDGIYYTFTPKLTTVTFGGKDYIPALIKSGNKTLTDNALKNSLTISFIFSNTFARSMLANFPENPLRVTLYRNELVHWGGQVDAINASGAFINLICTSSYTKATRPILTRKVQILCPYTLYGASCLADKSLFSFTVTINTISSDGIFITVTGITQANNYFLDGQFIWNGQTRNILKQTGGSLRISHPLVGTPTGLAVVVAGCDKKETTCLTKFNNVVNHGGFRRLPTQSPYNAQGVHK